MSTVPHLLLSSPIGHLAAVHRSKGGCFQEHQDHRWVPGWRVDQCSQGRKFKVFGVIKLLFNMIKMTSNVLPSRVHLTPTPSRRRTSWRELPSPTVKHVCFLTKEINSNKFLLMLWVPFFHPHLSWGMNNCWIIWCCWVYLVSLHYNVKP